MSWHTEKNVSGWCVKWTDGGKGFFSFRPNQFGKVRSASHQHIEATPCAFGVVQERVAELLPQLKQHRFGRRHSAERGVLCGRISSHLNGLGIAPVARVSENDCPGHIASQSNPKICGRCGVHIDSLRPDDEQ